MAVTKKVLLATTCLAVTLALATGFQPLSLADTGASSHTQPGPQSIRGEVILITDDFYLVKDAVGKGMVQVLVSKATRLEKPIRMGDNVVAELSKEGVAVSIKKAQ